MTVLDNFHPISNLPFLGKVVERVAGCQLQRALAEVDYLNLFQAGFKLGYSMEMALVALVGEL